MVANVVAVGLSAAPGVPERVKRRSYAELLALGPKWVVVVIAVDSVYIERVGEPCSIGVFSSDNRNWPLDEAGYRRALHSKLLNSVFKLLDGFLGRMHRNYGRR